MDLVLHTHGNILIINTYVGLVVTTLFNLSTSCRPAEANSLETNLVLTKKNKRYNSPQTSTLCPSLTLFLPCLKEGTAHSTGTSSASSETPMFVLHSGQYQEKEQSQSTTYWHRHSEIEKNYYCNINNRDTFNCKD